MYPYTGQIISGQQTISVLAEDNFGIDSVDFFINSVLVHLDNEEPYEYDWNTEFEFEDANHIIGSIITDLAGNQFEIPSISVFVNNMQMIMSHLLSISNPVSGQTVSGSINFTVNVDDNVGITQVEFFIDGYSLGVVTEEPYSYLWDTTSNIGAHGDEHALSAIVIDTAGNTSFPTNPCHSSKLNEIVYQTYNSNCIFILSCEGQFLKYHQNRIRLLH